MYSRLLSIVPILAILPQLVAGQMAGKVPDYILSIGTEGSLRLVDRQNNAVDGDPIVVLTQHPGAFVVVLHRPGYSDSTISALRSSLRDAGVVLAMADGPEFVTVDDLNLNRLTENADSAREGLARFSDCLARFDEKCIDRMTIHYSLTTDEYVEQQLVNLHPSERLAFERWAQSSFSNSNIKRQAFNTEAEIQREHFESYTKRERESFSYYNMEVSEPYALVRSSADRYLIAEYSLTAYTGFWVERHGYLIGVYDEELGEWRFADSHMVQAAGVRKFVPNADLSMLPSTLYFEYARLFPLETEYLTTVEGGFRIQGDGEHAYFELEFDINKRIREEMDVLILFENPSNAEDPITVHTTLAERQKELLVQSPLIAGFKPMHIYGVTVVGLSADDEDEFVHRQPLYYFPIHGGDGEFVTGLATTGIGTERIIGMP